MKRYVMYFFAAILVVYACVVNFAPQSKEAGPQLALTDNKALESSVAETSGEPEEMAETETAEAMVSPTPTIVPEKSEPEVMASEKTE